MILEAETFVFSSTFHKIKSSITVIFYGKNLPEKTIVCLYSIITTRTGVEVVKSLITAMIA